MLLFSFIGCFIDNSPLISSLPHPTDRIFVGRRWFTSVLWVSRLKERSRSSRWQTRTESGNYSSKFSNLASSHPFSFLSTKKRFVLVLIAFMNLRLNAWKWFSVLPNFRRSPILINFHFLTLWSTPGLRRLGQIVGENGLWRLHPTRWQRSRAERIRSFQSQVWLQGRFPTV